MSREMGGNTKRYPVTPLQKQDWPALNRKVSVDSPKSRTVPLLVQVLPAVPQRVSFQRIEKDWDDLHIENANKYLRQHLFFTENQKKCFKSFDKGAKRH